MNQGYDYICPSCGKGVYIYFENISKDVSAKEFFVDGVTIDYTCPYCFAKYSMFIEDYSLDMHILDKKG
jgi:hypothetical protein